MCRTMFRSDWNGNFGKKERTFRINGKLFDLNVIIVARAQIVFQYLFRLRYTYSVIFEHFDYLLLVLIGDSKYHHEMISIVIFMCHNVIFMFLFNYKRLVFTTIRWKLIEKKLLISPTLQRGICRQRFILTHLLTVQNYSRVIRPCHFIAVTLILRFHSYASRFKGNLFVQLHLFWNLEIYQKLKSVGFWGGQISGEKYFFNTFMRQTVH